MRLGVLDVGSNSVKLQVVDGRSGAPPLKTSAFKDTIRLAECTDGDGAITDDGSARLVDATKRAVAVADAQGVTELIGFATAAIRDARNGSELCALLDHAAGVPLRALTGDDEARFTFLAARRWFGWSAGPLLVLDIGGGSLEVACGRDEEPDVAVSLPLGAGRLTRDYLSEHPAPAADVGRVRHEARRRIADVAERLRWERRSQLEVGTSKTFEQLARLAGAPAARKGPFARRSLERGDLKRLTQRLARMTEAERTTLRGVSRSRARQILAGAIVAYEAMRAFDVDEIRICPWALREGILLRRLDRLHDPVEQHEAEIIATATVDPQR